MDAALTQEPLNSDLLYQTTVMLQDETCRAFLFVLIDRVEIVAIRLDQIDRVRRYIWPYHNIRRVVRAKVEGYCVLYVYINDQTEANDTYEVLFSSEIECNLFANRINALLKLSRNSVSESGCSDATDSVIESQQHISPTNQPRQAHLDEIAKFNSTNNVGLTTPEQAKRSEFGAENNLGLNMFSPENLRKLAASSSQDSLSELLNGQLVIDPSQPHFDATGILNSDGSMIVPIQINVPGTDKPFDAAAKMRLKFDVDTVALKAALKIQDRLERIAEIRNVFKLNVDSCELSIS